MTSRVFDGRKEVVLWIEAGGFAAETQVGQDGLQGAARQLDVRWGRRAGFGAGEPGFTAL